MDGAAAARGVRAGREPSVSDPRSGSGLWRTIFTSGQDIEPPTGGHRTTLALAKCLCGAGDWLDSPGILDHVVVIGERHLRGILSTYVDYYNGSRTHLS